MFDLEAAKKARPAGTIVPPFPRLRESASFGAWVKALLAWYNATRIARALTKNVRKGAPVMAAGMAYLGIFSVFAGLWAVFSVLGLFVTGRADLEMFVLNAIDAAIPGLIGEGNAVDPATLLNASVFGWTGAIALVTSIWTALGWLNGARTAIRTIFEVPPQSEIVFVLAKLRDLGLVIAALLLVLISSASVAVGSGALTWALGLVGVSGDSAWVEFLIEAGSFVVAVAFDAVLLAGIVRWLANLRVPKRILFPAALVGGLALTVIKALAAMLVGGASANPLVATFAALLSVLILFNIMASVQLLVAAWVKETMDDYGVSPRMLTAEQAADEARMTAVRAQRQLLAAEELQLRETLRDAPRFTHRRERRRLRDVERERRELEQIDLELRMWHGSRPDVDGDADGDGDDQNARGSRERDGERA